MTRLLQRRPLMRPLLEATPFDRWFRTAFEDGDLFPEVFEDQRLPRADVGETDKDYWLTVELPGLDEKDVHVELSGNLLTVSGERKQRKEEKNERFHRVECTYGNFQRSFQLPPGVRNDADAITAAFDKGMLEVRIPKLEPKPVTEIRVKHK